MSAPQRELLDWLVSQVDVLQSHARLSDADRRTGYEWLNRALESTLAERRITVER